MLGHARLIWRDATLRLVAAGILLFGAFASSLGIHQSLIAVEAFGLSDGAYAGVLAMGMAVAVGSAVAVGIATDRGPRRRRLAMLAGLAMVAGPALVWALRSPAAFVAAHVLLMPVAGTIFGQLLAVARLASAPYPPAARDGVLALLRALFAVPFALGLPLWGLALNAGAGLLAIYPVVGAAGALTVLLIWLRWPPDARAPWAEAKSGLGVGDSLRELAAGPVALRVALMGAAHTGGALAGIVLGLIFADAGRPAGDVGVFFGAFVVIEVAGTVAVGTLVGRVPRLVLMAAGTVLYAAFLSLLPFLAASPWVWALVLPAGVGGALIYVLAIAYLRDLVAARPGAGASLMAVQRVSSEGLTTAAYAVGTHVQGYATASILGGAVAVAAMGAILRLDGPGRAVRRSRGPPRRGA